MRASQKEAAAQVCIVDDDASVRKSLANLLKSAGYQTWAFASGEAFLASSALDQAACVLLDMRMEGLQGLEVQRLLTAAGKPIAVIGMSAHDDEAAVAKVLQAGARGFLRKPFTEDALLAAIASLAGPRA
ncbi:MAG: response regulator [Pseudomonas sp.]|uniref:response regulator n=1 Tax=Pseudomonas abieticivorans TaxID=2931382 RepID=UPI0020BE75CA|nr:response regulator [Pseudomonas sp. PIA16]MDE1164890.1 response regulator [Pseudomonas sp.]